MSKNKPYTWQQIAVVLASHRHLPFPPRSSRKPKGGPKDGPKRPAGAYLLFLKDFRRGFLQARKGCSQAVLGKGRHAV